MECLCVSTDKWLNLCEFSFTNRGKDICLAWLLGQLANICHTPAQFLELNSVFSNSKWEHQDSPLHSWCFPSTMRLETCVQSRTWTPWMTHQGSGLDDTSWDPWRGFQGWNSTAFSVFQTDGCLVVERSVRREPVWTLLQEVLGGR